jgi:NAD(P)H-dependent nitrite reductase small subunit
MRICSVNEVIDNSGVAALVGGEQLAVFRIGGEIHVIGNRDPFSGANVLSRGIVGELNGELVVASPVYKQHFSLLTGRCIEDPSVSVPVYRARIEGADIRILQTGESPCRT